MSLGISKVLGSALSIFDEKVRRPSWPAPLGVNLGFGLSMNAAYK